ncbi:FAD-dependent monooxygenase [Amycolatopsis suaedae]|uniref:Monooxygenase n=1 Tax=Amycolatopsis suaedae TaxID=2510978 RepID=A0A4Q7J2T8_9PSEU|nr:FAD-dependent monooxygenase [Amycolatopsis suaedae]RZQ61791.1 monooxygenase [Amycolatopsis suaedae]
MDVVIAGAGPTGLALANELALAGVRTVVLERLGERVEQLKGGALQPRTREQLDMRGLHARLAQRALRESAGGHFALLPVPLDCTPWNTRYPRPLVVPQWIVEEELQAAAEANGAVVWRGSAVERVEQHDDHVTVHTGRETLTASWLVACDGAHSTVRRLLGLPFPGRGGTYGAALADIRLSATSETVPTAADHISGMTQRAGDYWAMLVPLHGDEYRLTFGDNRLTDPPRTPVSHAEIEAVLHAVYGTRTRLAEVRNASRFSDATRQLTSYRHGRVLFAGDAAHIHPPLGGQGLNLGVQDAFNLGWKLAATVQGWAPDGLLDTYQAERHPAAARVLRHTSAQRVVASPEPDTDAAALREMLTELTRLPEVNTRLAGLMSGLDLRYDLPGDHPLTGGRLPDPSGRLAPLLHRGRPVLLDGGANVKLAHPRVARVPFAPLDAPAVLLRPDGYVAWAGDGDPGEAAERWFGAP